MVEYIINAPETSKNKPKGTRYFIKVGSVMYTLFACLSRENIAFGVSRSIKLKIKANTPMGRLGQPEEIGNVIRFLLSEESAKVNSKVNLKIELLL